MEVVQVIINDEEDPIIRRNCNKYPYPYNMLGYIYSNGKVLSPDDLKSLIDKFNYPEFMDIFNQVFSQLSLRDQSVMKLRFQELKSIKYISETIGISIFRVRQIMINCRRRFIWTENSNSLFSGIYNCRIDANTPLIYLQDYIPVRLINSLLIFNYPNDTISLKDVSNYSYKQILKIPNIGKKSAIKLIEILNSYGLSLKDVPEKLCRTFYKNEDNKPI